MDQMILRIAFKRKLGRPLQKNGTFIHFCSLPRQLPEVYIDIAGLAKERHLPLEQRIENYRSPDPIGVLQVTILEARDLPVADFGLAGGSSDPYVVVKIGTTKWTTSKRVKTLNPHWGKAHSMDFLVYHMEQKLFVDVYDSDLLSKDDLLGYVSLDGKRPRIVDLDEEQATWRTYRFVYGTCIE